MQGLCFVWKINPNHALQVSQTYPGAGVVIITIRLNKLNVLGAEQHGSRLRLGLECTIGPDLPGSACDPVAAAANVAENEGQGYQDECDCEYDDELFRSILPTACETRGN